MAARQQDVSTEIVLLSTPATAVKVSTARYVAFVRSTQATFCGGGRDVIK
jgi:hypothetical protein